MQTSGSMSDENAKPNNEVAEVPIVIVEEEPRTPKQESMDSDRTPVIESINEPEQEQTHPNSGNQTPGHLHSNGIMPVNYYEDDASEGDFDEQNIMDQDEYDDDSMNEMLNLMRANETIVDQLAPPDGGYGWVIVAMAFFNNMVVDGLSNTFGSFMTSYEKEFGESKALTSFIGALLIACTLLSAPFAGGLLNRYNARLVVIAGALIASLGFFVATFSPTIFVYLIFYGLVGGVGFGLIYLPGIVVVSQYFESKRALATGVAVAGSGFGTFLMPVLNKTLIEQISWRAAIYVNSVFILLCAISGLFFKPFGIQQAEDAQKPSLKQRLQKILERFSPSKKQQDSSRRSSVKEEDAEKVEAPRRISTSRPGSQFQIKEADRPLLNQEDSATDAGTVDDEAIASPRRLSPINEGRVLNKGRAGSQHHHGERFVPAAPRTRKQTITSMTSEWTTGGSRANLANQLSRISVRSYAQSLSRLSQINPSQLNPGESMASIAISSVDPKEFSRPFNRKDVFYAGSIKNLKEFENEGSSFKNYRESQISIPKTVLSQSIIASRNTSQLDIADISSRLGGSRYSRIGGGLENEDAISLVEDDSKCKWIPQSIRNSITEMIDISLLKDPVMVLMCLCNIVAMFGFYVPLVFIIDLAVAGGATVSEGTLLLSICGLTNTAGRVFFGWVADRHWLSALFLSNASLLLCGLLTVACYFSNNYIFLVAYSGLFGFAISAFVSLTSIVLSDLLGIERLTNSFGLLILSRGVAALFGSPLAGCVYDMTNSYGATFLSAGLIFVLAGLIGVGISYAHRYQRSLYKNEGDYNTAKDPDALSAGKLSVLSEHSEEEYQRTIQSVHAQQELLRGLESLRQGNKVSVVDEENVGVDDATTPIEETEKPVTETN
ncbi:Monocarboxylate transporter 5 [Aphelenchoides bicaudatus]|nr:Monocarboxylate transporter 5 [Aphelenchoides bicaudatus]